MRDADHTNEIQSKFLELPKSSDYTDYDNSEHKITCTVNVYKTLC
jgi:hypothetical protein